MFQDLFSLQDTIECLSSLYEHGTQGDSEVVS